MLKSKPKSKGRKKPSMLFKILDAITYTKENLNFTDPEVLKAYDVYTINRWLSMVDMYLKFVNDTVNRYAMDKESHFNFLRSSLPTQKVVRWNYIKKNKNKTLTEIKYIANYFEVGLNEAELYVNLMSEESVNELLNKYKHGRNKMADV